MNAATPPASSATGPDFSPMAKAELIAALNELLEAERAGARVAMDTGREVKDAELALLVQDIHKDEVRWCGMLMRSIGALEATPSSVTGAFWGKAMAIPDLEQRLTFLNRGQSWVVRKLQALIPRVPDEALRIDLSEMLAAHHTNIKRVEVRSASRQSRPES